jgi:hypothetical protein
MILVVRLIGQLTDTDSRPELHQQDTKASEGSGIRVFFMWQWHSSITVQIMYFYFVTRSPIGHVW